MFNLSKPAAAGLLLLAGVTVIGEAQAQEAVPMGNGASITVSDYLVETPNDGSAKTLIVKGVPNFDPEPYGQVPADNFARFARQLCTNLTRNSWDQLVDQEIGFVRVRYDFTPSKPAQEAEGFTVTRFHEMRYALTDDRDCDPIPYGVRDVAPAIPSDVGAVLKYIEYGPDPRQLTLTYRLGDPAAAAETLERAAIELCITHADPVLANRAKWYQQLEPERATIAFVSGTQAMERETRVSFPIVGDHCETGLSAPLVEAIRSGGAEPASE